MVPTASHGAATAAMYSLVGRLEVVANAADAHGSGGAKQPFVLGAGRWWDEGKNAATADAAAALSHWPVRLAGALDCPNASSVSLRHADGLGSLLAGAMLAQMRRAAIFFSP